jgi:hypothetical protein
MDPLDLKSISFPESRLEQVTKSRKPPRHKPGEKFLKGPIPLKWLTRAAKQPGKTLHIAIALWFLAGLKRKRTVALSDAVPRVLGVDRYAKYRALNALEEAGLVSVERHVGRSPVVTILDGDESEAD